jgi:hypothetical protein
MQTRFIKYYVFGFFFVFAILLFLLERLLVGVVFETTYHDDNIIDQIAGKINFAFGFLSSYVFILALAAVGGFFWSRKKSSEISKGFLYSMRLSGALILLFLVLIIYWFAS